MTQGNTLILAPQAAAIALSPETASSAVAAQAKAAVEARYLVARSMPRNMDMVRQLLLRECSRPRFAAGARYVLSFGGTRVEGPSIRLAEAALRAMTNVLPETMITYDDAEKRIVRVSVTDLEANLTYSKDVVIEKTAEKSKLRRDEVAIRQRTNSFDTTVYTVPISEGELVRKQGAAESKALRVLALRLLPGDILDEAMDTVLQTLAKESTDDPDKARKQIADAFAGLGVTAADLSEYLSHDLAKSSPAEMTDLRAIFAAIRDGEAAWQDAVSLKRQERGESSIRYGSRRHLSTQWAICRRICIKPFCHKPGKCLQAPF